LPSPGLAAGDATEQRGPDRPQPRTGHGSRPPRERSRAVSAADQRRMGPLQPAIGRSVDAAAPSRRPLGEPRKDRGQAAPSRCYHRPSLRQFLRSTLRRARWGLFFALGPVAPIPLSARSLRFHR
jgi:hypothetical protein